MNYNRDAAHTAQQLWRDGLRQIEESRHAPRQREYERAIAALSLQLQRYTTLNELVRAYFENALSDVAAAVSRGATYTLNSGLIEDCAFGYRHRELMGGAYTG
jgi:uncharacterized membrane protein